jgi:cytochrome c553
MFKKAIFLIVLALCAYLFADEEITIKATGDFAKELKNLVEKYQKNDINGTIEIIDDVKPASDMNETTEIIDDVKPKNDMNGTIEIIDDVKPVSEEERLQNSPIERAIQEEINKDKGITGSTSKHNGEYDQYFSDKKQSNGGILDFLFGENDKNTADKSKGKELYEAKCVKCHGQNAQQSTYSNARNLITLDKNEIIYQIKRYKADSGHGQNTGFIMRSQAIMLNDGQIKNIAEFIDSLKKVE